MCLGGCLVAITTFLWWPSNLWNIELDMPKLCNHSIAVVDVLFVPKSVITNCMAGNVLVVYLEVSHRCPSSGQLSEGAHIINPHRLFTLLSVDTWGDLFEMWISWAPRWPHSFWGQYWRLSI